MTNSSDEQRTSSLYAKPVSVGKTDNLQIL